MSRTAIIAGHTGLVGAQLLQYLLVDTRYRQVIAIGRRTPGFTHARLQAIKTELGELRQLPPHLAPHDAFCCLGTTQRAAGSKAAFERVDFHMVVAFARAARASGAKRFFVVSALAADPRSLVYYSRVKGRTEQALREIGFDTLQIVRPSLLLGPRSENRPAEAMAQKLAPLFSRVLVGPLAKYRAIAGDDVARAIIELSHRDVEGTQVHTLPLAR